MNEQIKELIAQATEIYTDNISELPITKFNKEKFAELIVLKCAHISVEADDTMTNQGVASAQAFMNYFGVV